MQQAPNTFTIPAQRADWARSALQRAGVKAQAQRTGQDYAITVKPKDAQRAAQALEPIMNYAPPRKGGNMQRWKHISVFGFVGAILTLGYFMYGTNGQQPFANTTQTNSLHDFVWNPADPYFQYIAGAMAIVCVLMLLSVWGAKPPDEHPEWAGAPVGKTMFAVVVFCVCFALLGYAIHSGGANGLTEIYQMLGAK